jgi:tetratricopeptide (TPR) repeat protein
MKIAYRNHTYEVFEQNSRREFIAMPNPTTYIVRHQNFAIAIDGLLMKNADGSVMCFEQPSRAIGFGICYIDSLCESERLILCGINAANNDDADDAEVFFRKAVESNPANSQAYWRLGACLNQLGRYVEAEAAFRRAVEGDDSSVNHFRLGYCLLQQKRYEEAEKTLQRALSRDADHLDTRVYLGACLLEQERYEEAEEILRKAVRMDLRHLSTYFFLGSLLLKMGRFQNAISMFKTALKIQPDWKNAQELLDLAVEWRDKTTTSSPPSPHAAITEKMHDALETDLAAGDPKAINFVKNTRAELNAAREGIGRSLFID